MTTLTGVDLTKVLDDRYGTRRMNEDEKREFYKSLRERIHQLRMGHLFEEPCPLYEPEWEDDEHF